MERETTTWKVLLVLLVGGVLGFLVLFADAPTWDHPHRVAARSSTIVLWAALMCAQTAFWALALFWLLPTIRSLPAEYARANRSEIVGSTLAVATIIGAYAIGGIVHNPWPDYLPGHAVKLVVLTVLGAVVSLVAARGIWFVHGGLKELGRRQVGSESLETFLSLQEALRRFLGVLGAIIALLVLSTGAHRQAVLSYSEHHHPPLHTRYGFELVLIYGFLATILVAAIYLPTSLTRRDIGGRIRDAVVPLFPLRSDTNLADQIQERESIGRLLALDRGIFGDFRAGVAILAPLLASLVGLLLSSK